MPSSGINVRERTEYRECSAMRDVLDDQGEPDIEDCGFSGDVDVAYDPELSLHTAYWTCPNCGTEHEVDLDDEAPEADEL